MNDKHYELRFLPLFEEDLSEIVGYIARHLNNPIAAENLVAEVQKAIQARTTCKPLPHITPQKNGGTRTIGFL